MDKNTNLPEVPEGWYWKISYRGLSHYAIKLKKSNKFWFDSTLHSFIITRSNMTVELIQSHAQFEYDRWRNEIKQEKLADSFIGKYPPKKLGES